MRIRKIAIIGAGNIGGSLGMMLGKAGYEIFYSSRHPEKLEGLVQTTGPNTAYAGTAEEAIAFGDLVILSVPLKSYRDFSQEMKQALKGKVVIDTSNPYPERDGAMAEEARQDPGGMGSFVSRLLPGARIVRAFNTVFWKDLRRTVNDHGEKIAIPIAGDDREGLEAAVELAQRIGLDPVVVGGLSTSKLFDVDTPVYATSASAKEVRQKLGLE